MSDLTGVVVALQESADRLESYARRFRELAPRIEQSDIELRGREDMLAAYRLAGSAVDEATLRLERAKVAVENLVELLGSA